MPALRGARRGWLPASEKFLVGKADADERQAETDEGECTGDSLQAREVEHEHFDDRRDDVPGREETEAAALPPQAEGEKGDADQKEGDRVGPELHVTSRPAEPDRGTLEGVADGEERPGELQRQGEASSSAHVPLRSYAPGREGKHAREDGRQQIGEQERVEQNAADNRLVGEERVRDREQSGGGDGQRQRSEDEGGDLGDRVRPSPVHPDHDKGEQEARGREEAHLHVARGGRQRIALIQRVPDLEEDQKGGEGDPEGLVSRTTRSRPARSRMRAAARNEAAGTP